MTIRLAERGIRVVLLDIEGTTTPLAFVRDVLFPFARERAAAWFERDAASEDGRAWMAVLKAEHDADAARGEPVPNWRDTEPADAASSALLYVLWLMDRDRKSPALKDLQGRLWEQGYQSGVLRGVVFDDVPEAFARWREAGVRIAIYSSGSELAQRRLFESAGTEAGSRGPSEPTSLARYIDAYFDTRVGAKRDAESYRTIGRRLGVPAAHVLFVSDVTAELAAARDAGCQVVLSLRPGNDPQPDAPAFTAIRTFAELV